MPDNAAGHLSDDVLAELADDARAGNSRAREHLKRCDACRRRCTEALAMRAVLAQAGERERSPRRDVVAGAVKRLRLRRHAVTNVNELLDGLVSLVRGVARLLAAGSKDDLHG